MIVLLPCYSLEDFSLYRETNEANDIFSAWTALFHPLLMEQEGSLPEWEPAGSPNVSRTYSLVVIPPSCESTVPEDAIQKMEEAGTILVRGFSTRDEIVEESLRLLGITPAPFDSDLVDTFYSLGLAYFVSDLLTRKLRYMSDIDSVELEHSFFNAIKAYRENDSDLVKDELQKGFDRVCEATEYYFPSPAKFVDLTRTSKEDAPDSLRIMLERRAKRQEWTNLLPDLDFIQELESRYPDTLDLLRREIKSGRVALFGPDSSESPLYLLPQTEILRRLVQGRDALDALLGSVPRYYGRTRAGLSPVLPQLLRMTGYKAALLFTTDGWTSDYKNQTRLNWKDRSGQIVPTLAKPPINAEDASSFMELLDDLGYAWHSDDVMTSVFAHAPNREVLWWGDIARTNRFAPIIAEVIGIREYIDLTETAGQTKILARDDFRTNFLTRAAQGGQEDPVSQWNRFYSDYFRKMADRGETLFGPCSTDFASDAQGTLLSNPSLYPKTVCVGGRPFALPPGFSKHILAIGSLDERTETLIEMPPLSRVWLQFEQEPVDETKRKKKKKKSTQQKDHTPLPSVKKGLWQGVKSRLFGGKPVLPPPPCMVELVTVRHSRSEIESYYLLRNELLELRVDPVTGAMKRLATPNAKSTMELSNGLLRRPGFGNRFSWQLALKMSEEEKKSDGRDPESSNFGYTIMAADKFRILSAGPVTGTLQVSGRLVLPDGTRAAKYTQKITLMRNSPVIEVEVAFQPDKMPTGHTWDNYFGYRFAWKDSFAEVRTGVHEMLWKSDRDYLQAPECLDIRAESDSGITILSNGLPFYRLIGTNRLDCLLITRNETQQTFRFGIGIDLADPIGAALGFMAPSPSVQKKVKKPVNPFFRVCELQSLSGAVLPVDVEPVYNTDSPEQSEPVGFGLTLLERASSRSSALLRCERPIEEIKVVDLSREEERDLAQDVPDNTTPEVGDAPSGDNPNDDNPNGDDHSESQPETTPVEAEGVQTEEKNEIEPGKKEETAAVPKPEIERNDERTCTIHLKRNRLMPLEIRLKPSGPDQTKERSS